MQAVVKQTSDNRETESSEMENRMSNYQNFIVQEAFSLLGWVGWDYGSPFQLLEYQMCCGGGLIWLN